MMEPKLIAGHVMKIPAALGQIKLENAAIGTAAIQTAQELMKTEFVAVEKEPIQIPTAQHKQHAIIKEIA